MMLSTSARTSLTSAKIAPPSLENTFMVCNYNAHQNRIASPTTRVLPCFSGFVVVPFALTTPASILKTGVGIG